MRLRLFIGLLILAAMVYFIGFPPQPTWSGKVVAGAREKIQSAKIPELPTTGKAAAVFSGGAIKVYFCAVDDCVTPLSKLINESSKTDCALYDVTIPGIADVLQQKAAAGTARLVVDEEATAKDKRLDFAKRDTGNGLMHDKFCIFDGKTVMLGSFNPTGAGAHSYDNNLLIIQSPELAENYQAEFEELWGGQFGKGGPTPHPTLSIGGIQAENAFCPEDWCANDVLRALHPAEKSIDFLLYSFTHDQIGDVLADKQQAGIKVRGVMEKSQNNAYDEFDKLAAAGIPVRWDGNKGLMHHKVFIIDGETVITGSFNPSKNADQRNDENILIIHDAAIAAQFEKEFERVYAQASS